MANAQKNNKKNAKKIQMFKFPNSLCNFGRDHSEENIWILGSKSVVYFQTGCCLKFFSRIWSHVNENKNKK